MSKNLAQSLNNILEIIKKNYTGSGDEVYINPSRLEPFKEETDYLRGRTELSPFQAIIFAVIVDISATGRCTISKVASRLGMSYLQFLSYAGDLNALRDRGLIRIKDCSDIKLPASVINALMTDKPIKAPKTTGLSNNALVGRICNVIKGMWSDEYSFDQALDEIDTLLDANPDTAYATACAKHMIAPTKMTPGDIAFFHILSYLYLKRGHTVFDMGDIEDYIKDEEWMECLRYSYEDGEAALQIVGVIEPAKADGLIASGSFSFKEGIPEEFFAGISARRANLMKTVDLSDLADRPAKQLFYNKEESTQVERLSKLLSGDSLKMVYASMKEKGLRTGFISLFYGDPGTGKTETVYQIARSTGRKILEADVAKLRNSYVGETEKNMRRLFADYRTAVQENDLTPILLFNEADAILGKRMEGAVKSVDRMENSVQNILLEEMENFNGIMIATTNLLVNLDPAFERRFLYKIRFNKPELEPRRLIWKSQFTSLSDEQALSLAREYSFSGGQIENIVRKYNIDSVLTGTEGGFALLRQYCAEESTIKSTTGRIGF